MRRNDRTERDRWSRGFVLRKVDAAPTERMTTEDPADSHQRAAKGAVLFDGKDEVLTASRDESAVVAQHWTDCELVEANDLNQDPGDWPDGDWLDDVLRRGDRNLALLRVSR
jgi:hypothetical protein